MVMKIFKCPHCNIDCIELRWAIRIDGRKAQDYPKPILLPKYWEYRYYCSNCKREWIYNNSPSGYIEKVRKGSEFVYDEKIGYLVANKAKSRK